MARDISPERTREEVSSRYLVVLRKSIAASLVLVICIFLLVFAPRLTALPIAAAFIVALVLWIIGKRGRYAGVLFTAFVVLSLAPVDVRPQHWFGVPRIVPYMLGYPSHEMFEAAERGEMMLGGCIPSGYDPIWVVTW